MVGSDKARVSEQKYVRRKQLLTVVVTLGLAAQLKKKLNCHNSYFVSVRSGIGKNLVFEGEVATSYEKVSHFKENL